MQQIFKVAQEKMEKSINALMNEYAPIRAGRATPAVLDRITVDYYGCATPIQQMAAISVPEPRTILITPWDKSTLRDIEKAILTSDLGLNPQNDGSALRLNFPPLTEERRRELVKGVYKYAEEAKVAVRSIRRDAMEQFKKLEKASKITEDDRTKAEKKMQDKTDDAIKGIDNLCAQKEKEIMAV